MQKTFYRLYTEGFARSSKDRYFSRFHNDTKSVFVNPGEENWFFIFLIMLPKNDHTKFKEHWNRVSILF